MRHPLPTVLATLLVAVACAPAGGSATVTLSGRVAGESGYEDHDRTYTFGAAEASADYNVTISQHTANYEADADGPFGPLASFVVYVPSLAYGPFAGTASITSASRGTAVVGNITGEIEEIAWTGNARHPVEVSGTFEGTLLGMAYGGEQETLEATDGSFTYAPRCDSAVGGSAYFLYCGSFADKGVPVDYGALTTVYDDCPADVRAAFVGDDGAAMSWDGAGFRIDGGPAYQCLRTHEGARVHCGVEKRGIDADGCTWEGTALAAPGRADVSVVAFARPTGDCGEVTRCTTWVQFP